jgi:hypothetical protein
VGNSWALMGLRSYLNKVSRKGTTFLKKSHFLIAKKRKESRGFLSFFLPLFGVLREIKQIKEEVLIRG